MFIKKELGGTQIYLYFLIGLSLLSGFGRSFLAAGFGEGSLFGNFIKSFELEIVLILILHLVLWNSLFDKVSRRYNLTFLIYPIAFLIFGVIFFWGSFFNSAFTVIISTLLWVIALAGVFLIFKESLKENVYN